MITVRLIRQQPMPGSTPGLFYPAAYVSYYAVDDARRPAARPTPHRWPWEPAADARRRARLAEHDAEAYAARVRERLERHRLDAEHDRVVERLRRLR